MRVLITTERLVIRPFTPADFGAIHAIWSDPEVMMHIPGTAHDQERSRARLSEKISHQDQHGFSKWAVTEKGSGALVGECGLQYLDSDIELGYKLARAHWGRGFAAEAAQACLDWALAERPEKVVAIVDPANTRSARVLARIGMVRDGTMCRFGNVWDFYVAVRGRAAVSGSGRPGPG